MCVTEIQVSDDGLCSHYDILCRVAGYMESIERDSYINVCICFRTHFTALEYTTQSAHLLLL